MNSILQGMFGEAVYHQHTVHPAAVSVSQLNVHVDKKAFLFKGSLFEARYSKCTSQNDTHIQIRIL